jgi:hypothetical protein
MTAAAFHPSFPGARDAARRFALALALSAVLHLLLAGSLALDAAQWMAPPMPSGALIVRIEPPSPRAERVDAMAPAPAALRAGRGRGGRNVIEAEAGVRAKREAEAPLALPQAPDPVYYSARDLDLYPRPAAPLDLDGLVRAVNEGAAARFRLLLLIDEDGIVTETSVIEGEPPRLGDALRAALAATRFLPGQRGGRPVKSRVTLSVDFDSPRPRGAAR